MSSKPNTSMNCELDRSVQRRAYDRGRPFIASVGRVYYRPQRGVNCTPWANCLVTFVMLPYFHGEKGFQFKHYVIQAYEYFMFLTLSRLHSTRE